MNTKLFDYIQGLSKKDKKTLSQKALKVSEEAGELAKAVLPYDSAYATRHRFVDKTKILEEVSDTILASISIAYDLGFSHQDIEEMIDRKSEKWQELQIAEDKVEFPLPYEIHITVSIEDGEKDGEFVNHFKNSCKELNVKSIVLDLENNSGEKIKDVMTSSKFYGDNRSVYDEVQRITLGLEYRNFKVVRKKIETVPWHPGAPDGVMRMTMPKNSYFESHMSVITDNSSLEREKIKAVSNNFNAHLSKNVFKKIEDDKFVVMITLRDYSLTFIEFEKRVLAMKSFLTMSNIQIADKEIVEFCLYDTKISHDYLWLK